MGLQVLRSLLSSDTFQHSRHLQQQSGHECLHACSSCCLCLKLISLGTLSTCKKHLYKQSATISEFQGKIVGQISDTAGSTRSLLCVETTVDWLR